MRLTEKIIRAIEPPNEGYTLTWDADLAGLGLRATAGGVKSFVFNYRTEDGRQRRATIGRWPALTATVRERTRRSCAPRSRQAATRSGPSKRGAAS